MTDTNSTLAVKVTGGVDIVPNYIDQLMKVVFKRKTKDGNEADP